MGRLNKNIISGLAIAAVGGLYYTWLNNRKLQIPSYAKVIDNFDVHKYMGKWFEIARLDFKYEKDLSDVSATYFLNKDGVIEVYNRGFNYKENRWSEAKGKAEFNGEKGRGALKVSFFGPFYSGYNVVMMEPDYETVLVFGDSHDNMWILSRKKTIDEEVKQKFIAYAEQKGYDTSLLTWTKHE